eukprot:TRINITY_DN23000_c0_g1_i1.p1 TRINITY_DN23000_c0_g1~~TRINITY_DN23000_c0_g1_i1.p1  ORF type:complete len:213 (+),score=20.85 TRINITY_DN23000_c0_g1_i1:53-640(+)
MTDTPPATTLAISIATDVLWEYSFNDRYWMTLPGSKSVEGYFVSQNGKGVADCPLGTVDFDRNTVHDSTTGRSATLRRTEFFDVVDWARAARGRDLLQGFLLFAQMVEDVAIALYAEREAENAAKQKTAGEGDGKSTSPRRVKVRRPGPSGLESVEVPVFVRDDFPLLQHAYSVASRQASRAPSAVQAQPASKSK